jgi:hypothetical protein
MLPSIRACPLREHEALTVSFSCKYYLHHLPSRTESPGLERSILTIMLFQWQKDVHAYALLVCQFQRDNAVANAFKRSRASDDGLIFCGQEAVTFFKSQFSHTHDEAIEFGRSLMSDSVCTRIAGDQVFVADKEVKYRFTWTTPEETAEKIMAQRLPALHNLSEDDRSQISSPNLNTDEERFSAYVLCSQSMLPPSDLSIPQGLYIFVILTIWVLVRPSPIQRKLV